MISHQHKFIFVEIQKTASKTVSTALGAKWADHSTAQKLIRQHGRPVWDKYFKFTFVRNPWARLVSGYFFRRDGGNQSPKDLEWAKLYPPTFKEFCLNLEFFKHIPGEDMFMTQCDWLSTEEGKIEVDHLGRYETLDHDWKIICRWLAIQPQVLPKINIGKHSPYQTYYDGETRKIVASHYQKDVEYFNYDFDQ
ncbi:MAG: sulfotransferase family 2 domain-containing protein [Candidatus Omnitrophica bacterium]|nr:sulfotransferase family 2 domain-containing protein [Candidatus Omnitrophota bacterium]